MDVEGRAEVLGRHRRAFQVPAWPARPPRRLPGWLPRLRAFPEGEVAGVPFGIGGFGVLGGAHVLETLPGQGAVLRVGVHVEVDVTVGRVGMAALDQPPHQGDHLGYVAGGAGLHVRGDAAEHGVGAGERPLVPLGHLPPGHALAVRHPDDLVVDVGDVPAEGDLVPAGPQPAGEQVEDHARPDVADVRGRLHGGAAQVQRRLSRGQRDEVAHGAGSGVVEAERHAARLRDPAACPARITACWPGPAAGRGGIPDRWRACREPPAAKPGKGGPRPPGNTPPTCGWGESPQVRGRQAISSPLTSAGAGVLRVRGGPEEGHRSPHERPSPRERVPEH